MTRTTIAIDDDLLKQMKEKAAREGRTLQDVANELLRQGFARKALRNRFKLELRGWNGTLQDGVDLCDRDKLFDLLDRR